MSAPLAESLQNVDCKEGGEDGVDDSERAHERQTRHQQRQICEGHGKVLRKCDSTVERAQQAAGMESKVSVLSLSRGVSLSSFSSLGLLERKGKLHFGENDLLSKRHESPASTCGSVPVSSRFTFARSGVERNSDHFCVFSSATTVIHGALASCTSNQPRIPLGISTGRRRRATLSTCAGSRLQKKLLCYEFPMLLSRNQFTAVKNKI